MVQAVLFDLDDTLFDHDGSARAALEAVRGCHACFARMPFAELESAHGALLEELHREVMSGRLDLDAARQERFRRLFGAAGIDADAAMAARAAAAYRERYLASRQAVRGAAALLPLVRARARVGVVSNNLRDEQEDKLRHCGLAPFVDALVVSADSGMAKPDPRIFAIALERLESTPSASVMLGDSWEADIAGARAAGIRAVWFNRRGVPAPDAGVPELRSLEPAADILRILFDAHRD
jgi:putative hydrolase of the HAD superfamily